MKEHSNIREIDFLKESPGDIDLSFDDLFHKYSKKVYGVAKSFYLDHEDSEEVVQEVFIKLWKNAEALDPSQSIHSYVITITKNVVLNFLRKKAVRQKYLLDQASILPREKNHVEDFVFYNDLVSKLNNCIDRLPPQRQKIFKLVFFEGLNADKIALELLLSKRTVEHHIYTANKFVRDQLKAICS